MLIIMLTQDYATTTIPSLVEQCEGTLPVWMFYSISIEQGAKL